MAFFGRNKSAMKGTPVDQVLTMRQQGIDNNRIIQTLQRDGYSSSQIFEAMNEADTRPAVTDVSPEDVDKEITQNFDPVEEQLQQPRQPQQTVSSPDYSNSSFKRPHEEPTNIPVYKQNSSEVEELVESVIEEKWNDLVKDINKIIEWKNNSESKINSLEQEFSSMKESFDKLHQAVIGKIGEYDKNILNVGAEVRAMEKVFSKVLPVFTEKVNDLSRVAEAFKKKN
ncbi:MAG: hypothetical protein KKF89_00350 [Nanoarchaeota archaeon]|nr:hypothetical protein [Patescibacteria group bacterium]MBU1854146.1 hypothetical protein [Nanoarchaeota archaeon]